MTAIEGMKLGAFDFLIKPCDAEESDTKIKKAFARKDAHEEGIRTSMVSGNISSSRSILEDY